MLKIISLRNCFAYTAKNEIKCYKVLERKGDSKIAYSPYQDHPFVLKHEETAILKRSFFSSEVAHGIHAFTNMSDAIALVKELKTNTRRREAFEKAMPDSTFSLRQWNWLVNDHFDYINKFWKETKEHNYEIFECVVPQGAKYYKGVWGAKYPNKYIPNIASSKMTVLRGINDVEEVVVSPEQKAEPTVEETVEERLSSIASSVGSMPGYGQNMYTSVTTTTTYKS